MNIVPHHVMCHVTKNCDFLPCYITVLPPVFVRRNTEVPDKMPDLEDYDNMAVPGNTDCSSTTANNSPDHDMFNIPGEY